MYAFEYLYTILVNSFGCLKYFYLEFEKQLTILNT